MQHNTKITHFKLNSNNMTVKKKTEHYGISSQQQQLEHHSGILCSTLNSPLCGWRHGYIAIF